MKPAITQASGKSPNIMVHTVRQVAMFVHAVHDGMTGGAQNVSH